MLNKRYLLLLFALYFQLTANAQFTISVNAKTGALETISHPTDKYKMNWIISSSDSIPTWQKPHQDWGMGKYTVEGDPQEERWTAPGSQTVENNSSTLLYKTKYMDVLVQRQPLGSDYLETYTFTNTSGKKMSITSLDVYTPFNDNYPDAATCATNRCNAHIWPGMHSSYANAFRMGGEGPHLGLVFTKGAMKNYAIENRDKKGGSSGYERSNVRGTIVLNTAPFSLAPGEKHSIQWRMFWHGGWDDFFKKAKELGFVKLSADKYVLSKAKNEKLHITVDANSKAGIKNKTLQIAAQNLGEHSQKVVYDQGRKFTMLNYLVVSSADNLIDQRVRFIVNNQQMNDSNDTRFGAYMVYDNELKKIFDKPVGTVSNADRDEGAERLGMGVLVAKWLQTHQDEKIYQSLMRYVKFVRNKLQTPDYKVYSNVANTSRHRGYNYPWLAHLYLETYKLTGQKDYLTDFYRTYKRYFKEFGHEFYSIDLRISDALQALDKAGMKVEKDDLLNEFFKVGDSYAKTGINYPKHEVNYEQSIVAPAVSVLCELYLVTKDRKYLDAAKVQMPSLEAFNGRQPDPHLYEIAIRHWDGYWFGKNPTWGDTMPHYWSAITALAFNKYYECTGDASYLERAKRIVENNLLNFEEGGQAHCAFLYPAEINGKPGKFYDQFANDQDWALVFYKEVMER